MPYCNHSFRFVITPACTGDEVIVGMFLLQLLTDCAGELVLATCERRWISWLAVWTGGELYFCS